LGVARTSASKPVILPLVRALTATAPKPWDAWLY